MSKSLTNQTIFAAINNRDAAALRAALAESPELIHAKDQRGIDPLTLATYTNNLELTKILVEAGANVNQNGGFGTPLMGVSFKGAKDIVAYLIAQGADLELSNHEGTTALMFAATYGQAEIVELLLAKGAKPNSKDNTGRTAADHAKAKGHTAIVTLLT